MSEKNVHQLQWKQKSTDQSINPSRNADILSNPSAAPAAATSSHPIPLGTTLGPSSSNGRYPLIGPGGQQISPSSTAASTIASVPISLRQHFPNMQHFQQQQQQQLQQAQQSHSHHHHPNHPQNQHFELTKIMSINSSALPRLEMTSVLGSHPVSSAITENVLSLIGMSSGRASDDIKIPDEDKLRKVQAVVEAGIGDNAKQQILQILDGISALKPVERLLLYLRMPGETPESDPLRQPQNPLGTRSEINHTINWVRSHLEHDPKVSIPKQDVYNDYLAYCERLDIKPLSTADFGKVMKQVFPEIRPRRLGTRGHSRYCYAAMRKTTKLNPPQLPIIGGKSMDAGSTDLECDRDGESWNKVRTWAEGLFSTKFENLKELAEHIGKNEFAAGGAGSSRVLLQKKILQRDAKEKRLYADSGPLKKRRKKKRKGSTSSESSTTQNASSIGSMNEPSRSSDDVVLAAHTIKQEILDSPNPQPRHPTAPPMHEVHHSTVPYESHIHGHQLHPMNLATETDRTKSLGGQLPASNAAAKDLTKALTDLAPNLLQIDSQTPLASVKEEIINEEYNPQNVICKKVRRAHLTKGILASGSPASATMTSPAVSAIDAQPSAQPIELPPATNYSMGPPAQLTSVGMESKLVSQMRARKLRLLQAHPEMCQAYETHQQQQQQQQQQHPSPLVDNVEITEDRDVVLPENLGLPRERVISICNMDKRELDDYLIVNDEDNSQDQEAELLQYFQTGDAENNNNNNNNNKSIMQQHQQQNLDAPNPTLTDINSSSAFEVPNKKKSTEATSGCFAHDRDDITQLRNYLHQNFNKDSNETIGSSTAVSSANQRGNVQGHKFATNGGHYTPPGVYNEGSISASLATMSQKHQNEITSRLIKSMATTTTNNVTTSIVNTATDTSIVSADEYNTFVSNVRTTQKRKINLNAMIPAPSTTQRRKNCTFYPIAPNINPANLTPDDSSSASCTSTSSVTTNANLFASPRFTASSVRNKPLLHKQHSLPAADKNHILSANDPMISASRNNRNYSTMASASAPPSPSILQDSKPLMFGKSYTAGNQMGEYNLPLINQDYQQNFGSTCSSDKMLTNDQNSLECVLDEPPTHLMAESRSRSVPLQYRNSPAFNQSADYTKFSSTCNSAAPTPVPPHFADFTDPLIMDMFSNTSPTHVSSIKVEEPTGNSLLCGSVADILSPEYGRNPNSFGGIVSRSVPSTPLPQHSFLGNKKHHQQLDPFSSAQSKYSTKMYDISKSMPTTPNTSNTATPLFRYSPEFNRDFLINGNTVESTPSYSRAPSVVAATGPSLSDTLLDNAREGGSNSLTDGMDDLGNFGDVSGSIIEAHILDINNL